jgi:hypothetical protein
MEANLDMNSHRVLNVGAPANQNDGARLKDVQDALGVSNGSPLTSANLILIADADGVFTSNNVEGALNEAIKPYPIVSAETIIGATIVDFKLPPGYVDRYKLNAVPGTTDMSSAVQTAVDVAQTVTGAGQYGCPIRFQAYSYLLTTPPTFATSSEFSPVDIGGVGIASQIINNAAPNTAPTFDMSGVSGWRIHDLLILGNSAHKNIGIKVSGESAQTIYWEISNVLALVPHYAIYLRDTNTGVIRDFRSWPGITADLVQIPQTVTLSDINHHIYMTGGFVHNVSIYDAQCNPNNNYWVGHRGIKLDAAACTGIAIIGGLFQTLSGLNSETGLDFQPSGLGTIIINAPYMEGAKIYLKNIRNSDIRGVANGGVSGGIVLNTACNYNVFAAIDTETLAVQDTTSSSNLFLGCKFTTITDVTLTTAGTLDPNRYIACTPIATDYGIFRRIRPTYSSSITIDTKLGDTFVIDVTNTSNFTITNPIGPITGRRISINIRNDSGTDIGTITWGSKYKMSAWTSPAVGTQRTITFEYDGVITDAWYAQSVTGDVPNV